MRSVTFLSRLWATDWRHPSYVISINDTDERPDFRVDHKDVLFLKFDDVDQHIDNSYRLFDFVDADKILNFIEQVPSDGALVVHCAAGVSRSAAVARFLVKDRGWQLKTSVACSGDMSYHNRRVYEILALANMRKGG